jgi:hypothetical protein
MCRRDRSREVGWARAGLPRRRVLAALALAPLATAGCGLIGTTRTTGRTR